jgi:hypothetical protein
LSVALPAEKPTAYNESCGAQMPTYERGDYIKVEFPDEITGVGEWMWVRVHHCDYEKKLVFGVLDNVPLNDYGNKLRLGSELAIAFDRVQEHKKSSDFESKN